MFPTNAKERKECPIGTGVLDYFPKALAAVARCSFKGNEQHNPGTPLHWDRSKSTDEADALIRHFLERGKTDVDGVPHSAKVAWRALALLEKELESGPAKDTIAKDVPEYERDYAAYCNADSPDNGWVCTRTKGHVGKHVAFYSSGSRCPVDPWD